jgi:N-acetylmuramoyl-L-alanine amidase
MTSEVRYKDRTETNLIILHDSHTRPDVGSAGEVLRWSPHAHDGGLKMGLLSIGYHDIIERDGTLVECRPHRKIGTHTPGFNMDSIGICLVGGRVVEGGDGVDNFTQEQRRTLLRRIHEYRTLYPTIKAVKGHSEVQRYRRNLPPCPPIDMDLLREDIELFAKGIIL